MPDKAETIGALPSLGMIASQIASGRDRTALGAKTERRTAERGLPHAGGLLGASLARFLGFGAAASLDVSGPDRPAGPWFPILTFSTACMLLLAAVCANASRAGAGWALPAFYSCIAALFFPLATRIALPNVSRQERIATLVVLTIGLFVVKLIREPIAFIDHDEFLHWLTAMHVLESHSLFTPNALLPVSPTYPGLEIATTALAQLTGMSVFFAGNVLLAVGRLTFVLGLFVFFERVTESTRAAALACLVYMGTSTFLIFDVQFSYESLAVMLLATALLASLGSRHQPASSIAILAVALPILLALAVTHHMTAFVTAGLLCAYAAFSALRSGRARHSIAPLLVALCAVAFPAAWSHSLGNPTSGYLGPVLSDGMQEAARLLTGSSGRKLFVSDDGQLAPAYQRLIALSATALVCVGLLTGFLRSLAHGGYIARLPLWRILVTRPRWSNSWLIVLSLVTLGFPLSLLFRLTRSGWEIGNRIGPFSFIGVAAVIAIAIASFWQGQRRSLLAAGSIGGVLTIMCLGGIISAQGPRMLVPANFKIEADSASIEPMGIDAAEWTREWLGRGHVIAADRVNRLLLATYGRQQVTTTLYDGLDTAGVFFSKHILPRDEKLLRDIGVEFLMADLRLTTGLPSVGVYFDGGSAEKVYAGPPRPEALLKFGDNERFGRVFDNGNHVIFDVRALYAKR